MEKEQFQRPLHNNQRCNVCRVPEKEEEENGAESLF